MAQLSSNQQDKTKSKLTQVFRFLQALDQLRNPVQRQIQGQLWTLWFRDLPDHLFITKGEVSSLASGEPGDLDDDLSAEPASKNGTDSFLLKVRRPELTEAPEPPEELLAWLENGWQKVEGEIKVLSQRTLKDEEGNPYTEEFQADAERLKAYQRWADQRNRWAETERPARQAMQVYDRLYSLHTWIERESEQVEFILGEGLLDWPQKEGLRIHHPVLLQRVQLLFDPDVPEFTIINAENPSELYTALFRSVSGVSAACL